MSWNLNVNDMVIGKSQALLNQVGRIVALVGDGGKRKFEVALNSGKTVLVAKRSIKKFVSDAIESNVLQQDSDADDERNANMETVVNDDASDSSSSESGGENDEDIGDLLM